MDSETISVGYTMWAAAVLILACVPLIPGKPITPEYKGCYSTRFVSQYAFYYKLNQSMNIQQGFAACNHRLTTYIGLQVDDSFTVNNFVFCGNDLTEVSLELDSFDCSTCQENETLSCGGTNSMSVYMVRELTPLALLLKTDRGVELLEDNITTVKVPYENTGGWQLVDYIYTEDLILFLIYQDVIRSGYNNIRMQFTKPKHIWDRSYPSYCFVVDFITHHIFFDGTDLDLVTTDTQGSFSRTDSIFDYYPKQITIDPFNRSLTYVMEPFDKINIWILDDRSTISHSLNHLNIEIIMALSMDIQEKYFYAIVQFMEDSSKHLVRMDYGISQIVMLFSGPQLENTTVLEVFRDHAVWLTNHGSTTLFYTCKLTPKCVLDHLTSYSSNQKIHDFTIYHPEKQTPGRKRLCANMTCSHGCQLFSPFTVVCTCPPGMELAPDNSTCNKRPKTTTTTTMTMTTKLTPTTTTTSSTTSKTSTYYVEATPVRAVTDLSTEGISVSPSEGETSKNINTSSSDIAFYGYVIMICIIIIFLLLIGICLLVIKLYKKVNHSTQALGRPIELKTNCNIYSELS